MKERRLTQIVVVNETSAHVFQDRVNAELMAHENVTDIRYQDTGSGFCAIITYEDVLKVVETAEDHFRLMGKRYWCNDCPYLELDPDRRSATHYCRKFADRVRLKSTPCEWFFEALKAGDVHLVTPEEREFQYETMDRREQKRLRDRTKELNKLRAEKQALAALDGPRKAQKLRKSEDK